MRVRLVALFGALGLMLAACSSSGNGAADPTSASVAASGSGAPEDHVAPDSEVADGLPKLKTLAVQIADAAATDSANAKGLSDGLETIWRPIEGTVKKTDIDVYQAIEDAFAQLESGDATQSVTGADALSAAVDKYLAAHPA